MRHIRRLAYTSKTISFGELGKDAGTSPLVPLAPLEPEPGAPKTMIKYIQSMAAKYPDAIVLTQVGSFYEIYFEQALEFGPKLDFKVAQKRQYNPVTGTNSIPMIGFPMSQLSKYTRILVQEWGKNVVVLSQHQDHVLKKSSEHLKRPVARILTPGTIIEEDAVDTSQQNFICCVCTDGSLDRAAVAWVDLGEGSVFHQTTSVANLNDVIDRINPREVVLDQKADLQLDNVYVSRHSFPSRDSLLQYRFMIDASEQSLRNTMDQLCSVAKGATSALLSYLHEVLPNTQHQFQPPKEYVASETMQMDRATLAALELFNTAQRNSREGSLFSVIRKTRTPSGSRLLQEYMTSPSRNLSLINWRLHMVDLFRREEPLRQHTSSLLATMPDGKRVIQKLGMQRPSPQELLKWVETVENFGEFAKLWKPRIPEWSQLLEKALETLNPLAKEISAKIKHQPKHSVQEPMKVLEPEAPSISVRVLDLAVTLSSTPRIKQLILERHNLIAEFSELERKYKAAYSSYGDVYLRYGPLYGYYCTLRIKQGDWNKKIQEHGSILTQTKKSVSFSTREITDLGSSYEACLRQLDKTQNAIIEKLRQKVLETTSTVRGCLEVIDMADVFQGLAQLAIEWNLTRPSLTLDPTLCIQGGRNLTVESGLMADGCTFTPNETNITTEKPIVMVTGPNMGGKSTYIRQVAIISLMAQMGSFVPAEYAEIGLIDRIFCRIGSGDDISRGRSTFLVEMMETSAILRLATKDSLALLDEVGRGTSENDGVAIAYASMKHMVEMNKCRAIFSTHYGPELQLALERGNLLKKVQCSKTQPRISETKISYDHRLVPGVCSEAHGLKMAMLAGFPEKVMARAKAVYHRLN